MESLFPLPKLILPPLFLGKGKKGQSNILPFLFWQNLEIGCNRGIESEEEEDRKGDNCRGFRIIFLPRTREGGLFVNKGNLFVCTLLVSEFL